MLPSAYLFVPADRPERFEKALASVDGSTVRGDGVVIIDLEDAVPAHRKDAGLKAAAAWLSSTSARVVVRVNALGSAQAAADLAICRAPAVSAVMIPKAQDPKALQAAHQACAGKPLLALIESAAGFEAASVLAQLGCVQRLVFGSIDFQLDLGLPVVDDPQDADAEEGFLYVRSRLVLVSRLAGLPPPVDGVSVHLHDTASLVRATARARRLGFGAKLCIHPRQVAIVRQGFLPSPSEIDWARRVLHAAAGSTGATTAVDGQMIDRPVILRAQALLARAAAAQIG